jgi:hypothetical protein
MTGKSKEIYMSQNLQKIVKKNIHIGILALCLFKCLCTKTYQKEAKYRAYYG